MFDILKISFKSEAHCAKSSIADDNELPSNEKFSSGCPQWKNIIFECCCFHKLVTVFEKSFENIF